MGQSKDHLGGNEEIPNPDKLIGKAAHIRAEQIAKEQARLNEIIKQHDNLALAEQIANTLEAEGAEVRADPHTNKAVITFGKKLGNGAIHAILLDAPRQAKLQKIKPSKDSNSIKASRSTAYNGVVVGLTYFSGGKMLDKSQRSQWVKNGNSQALVTLPDQIDLEHKGHEVASLCENIAMYSGMADPNDIVGNDDIGGF